VTPHPITVAKPASLLVIGKIPEYTTILPGIHHAFTSDFVLIYIPIGIPSNIQFVLEAK
jgi:hypothetical protein